MLHVADECTTTWREFDQFIHDSIPSLRDKALSIIMYGFVRTGAVVPEHSGLNSAFALL